jgi:SulP family sulfate permease
VSSSHITEKTRDVPSMAPVGWRLFVPKSVTVLREEGYSWSFLRDDAVAGFTVAVVALPLAMAIAIASGTTPQAGLITAVIAGFLISALGGSRFQIGGPTGAFIVVVYGVIQDHGYDGLLLATTMAGAFLIFAGLLRFGTWIKYIPEPVVTGFTAGIAVIIFTSQIRDLLGLRPTDVPADFLEKIAAFWNARHSLSPSALVLSLGALAAIVLLRRFAPKAPSFIMVIGAAAAAVALFGLNVETLGTRFGGIAATIPSPQLPRFSLAAARELVPSALTIAFLAGLESLLSAMVADGMTGRRHRSNCELVAQGIANISSSLFGGISATGAIARTATNIRAGARTPVAGMLHALFVLAFMLGLGPLLSYVPLASLAAVLVIVAWNMSELDRVRHLLTGPVGDRIILVTTFALTVLVDLTVAIEVGIVLAAIFFMHGMAEATAVETGVHLLDRDQDDFTRKRDRYDARIELPDNTELFELRGPLFFGAASRLNDVLDTAFPLPQVIILRLRNVPLADASGVGTLGRFLDRCASHRTAVILTELDPRVAHVLDAMGVLQRPFVFVADSYGMALEAAAQPERRSPAC